MVAHTPDKWLTKSLDDYQASLAINGDKTAFALLYKRWHPQGLKLALRLTRNRDNAEEVMQEAAFTIAKNIHRLEAPERFTSWAYTIVRRRSADHISRAMRHRAIKTAAEARPLLKPNASLDESLSLKNALTRLPYQDRLILTYCYVDGCTGQDISTLLGIPLGTVKSRLFTARQKLKQAYMNPKTGDRK